jgi:pimeloyl-ACP methyl ester carboxylesterase
MEPFAVFEYSTLLPSSALLRLIPRGDGHPVLVMPGFGASDRSTSQLRTVLRSFGHAPHGWRLGVNVGPHPETLAGIEQRLFDLHDSYQGKVSLVGWSLGGVYARELAREHPDLVRQVVTMASPFRYRPGDNTHASELYDLVGPGTNPFVGQEMLEHNRPALPVPSTSIYTRTDGIVRWHLCVESEGHRRENIEVIGTHTGLGHNIAAVLAVADRLAQPDGEWAPFRAPRLIGHLYPRPVNWVDDGHHHAS